MVADNNNTPTLISIDVLSFQQVMLAEFSKLSEDKINGLITDRTDHHYSLKDFSTAEENKDNIFWMYYPDSAHLFTKAHYPVLATNGTVSNKTIDISSARIFIQMMQDILTTHYVCCLHKSTTNPTYKEWFTPEEFDSLCTDAFFTTLTLMGITPPTDIESTDISYQYVINNSTTIYTPKQLYGVCTEYVKDKDTSGINKGFFLCSAKIDENGAEVKSKKHHLDFIISYNWHTTYLSGNTKIISDVYTRLLKYAVPTKTKDKHTCSIIGYNARQREFTTNEVQMRKNSIPLDLLYGEGFEEHFHLPLVKEIAERNVGIIMFFGLPGCGKTQYLRILSAALKEYEKPFNFLMPSIYSYIAGEEFTTFIQEDFDTPQVFVLEEASDSIKSRKKGKHPEIVEALLQLSDGVLSEMTPHIYILTCNTKVDEIDTALLRPGRCIAAREFKPLNHTQAIALASHIGVLLPVDDGVDKLHTLAEIFNLKNDVASLPLVDKQIADMVEKEKDASSKKLGY